MDVAGKDYAASLVSQAKGKSIREVTEDDIINYHKEIKKAIFNDLCGQEIEAGFHSHTNDHIYRTNRDDQINFIGQYLLLKEVDAIQQVFWKTEDSGQIPLTRDQFFNIYKEALMHKNNTIQKYWYKKIEVDNCTSHEQLRNVLWGGPVIIPGQPTDSNPTPTEPVTNPPADTTAPDDVADISSSNITDSGLTLSWTASVSTDVTAYQIYKDTEWIGTTDLTYYNVAGLTPSTTYDFTIKAVDGSNNVSTGVTVQYSTVATPVDPTPPADPTPDIVAPAEVTNLTETHTDTTATLSWTNPTDTDLDNINIYRDSVLIHSELVETFQDTGLTPVTAYAYSIKTVDTSGNESDGVSISVQTDAAAQVQSAQASIFSTQEEKPKEKKGFFRKRRR
jgi:chitodextrinase